jgi:predicted HTH domain antitoxin
MESYINVSYPQSLAFNLKLAEKEFANEIKAVSMVKLFELGKVSSGTASQILGISRVDFLEMLNKYQVSFYNYSTDDELNNDIENA